MISAIDGAGNESVAAPWVLLRVHSLQRSLLQPTLQRSLLQSEHTACASAQPAPAHSCDAGPAADDGGDGYPDRRPGHEAALRLVAAGGSAGAARGDAVSAHGGHRWSERAGGLAGADCGALAAPACTRTGGGWLAAAGPRADNGASAAPASAAAAAASSWSDGGRAGRLPASRSARSDVHAHPEKDMVRVLVGRASGGQRDLEAA